MRRAAAGTVLQTVARRWYLVYHGATANTTLNPKG